MMRIPALFASILLCLAGCFVFDNPFDTSSMPTATFQIVITSIGYGGTYVWSPQDNAYESMVGSTRYYVYMDSNGYWCLGGVLNQVYTGGGVIAHSTSSYANCALPPTTTSGWTGIISSIDDSAGGVYAQGQLPDTGVSTGSILQVVFLASSPGNSATYQWVRSPNQNCSPPTPLGTGSTYTIQSGDYAKWIRVIITPTDSTGKVQGTPVGSQPVRVP